MEPVPRINHAVPAPNAPSASRLVLASNSPLTASPLLNLAFAVCFVDPQLARLCWQSLLPEQLQEPSFEPAGTPETFSRGEAHRCHEDVEVCHDRAAAGPATGSARALHEARTFQ